MARAAGQQEVQLDAWARQADAAGAAAALAQGHASEVGQQRAGAGHRGRRQQGIPCHGLEGRGN